jgi:hypothetical protein
MVSTAPPPLLRDRKLDLDELQRLAAPSMASATR